MNFVLIRRSSRRGAASNPHVRRGLATLTLVLAGLASAQVTYRVRPGDNLTVIARRAGVSVAALKAANPSLKNANNVQAGKTLTIPGRNTPDRTVAGSTHRVKSGENLTVIARRYGLTLGQLLRANPELDAERALWAGATVRIPGRNVAARLPNAANGDAPAPRPGNRTPGATVRTASIRVTPVSPDTPSARGWLWPVPGYRAITSDFGPRVLGGEREMHYGVDILAPQGTLVLAARSGRVIESRADFERGWGWTVVLEHQGGWITRYAHLSSTIARTGERVAAGQPVGRVGNTGRSTGTHLHFGTYLRWDPRDPLALYGE
ncbi:peptidoglycan DD-metalloendopeptidase family protein [Deinococcus aetherius]|uniref:peptidoglycan DD-metalloendopeptidase family protein n=1 Tax=Deinococcus aetherius TaxID=200252 RepID=UPI002230A69B|nr:M23 family metallopeptidase [Deinococcus aetherius]